MTEHEMEAPNATDLVATAFEWAAVHGHEHSNLVELVVDTYLASAESVPA
jgi:hypothetical protein